MTLVNDSAEADLSKLMMYCHSVWERPLVCADFTNTDWGIKVPVKATKQFKGGFVFLLCFSFVFGFFWVGLVGFLFDWVLFVWEFF